MNAPPSWQRGFAPLPPSEVTTKSGGTALEGALSGYLGLAEWDDAAELVRTVRALWTGECIEVLDSWPSAFGGGDREDRVRRAILRFLCSEPVDDSQLVLFNTYSLWPRWLCAHIAFRLIEIVDSNYITFLAHGDERSARCLNLLTLSLDLLTAHGLPTHDVQVEMRHIFTLLETAPDDVLIDPWSCS
jgi:hypothetical protein